MPSWRSVQRELREDTQLPKDSGLLMKNDASMGRNGVGKGADSWMVGGLPGDRSRKTKFMRLLRGQKSLTKGKDELAELSAPSTEYCGHINADLERQYKAGLAYNK